MTALAMSIARFVAAIDMNALPRNPCWRKPRLGAPCTSSLRPRGMRSIIALVLILIDSREVNHGCSRSGRA